MKYVYPAVFLPLENEGFSVNVPDLPGCRTCGKSLAESIEMAEDALAMWLWDAENEQEPIPPASMALSAQSPAFINFIKTDTDDYRRLMDKRAVKKTVSLPGWLNAAGEKANAPFSQILQEGLKSYLGIR